MGNYRGNIGNSSFNPTESQVRKDARRSRQSALGQIFSRQRGGGSKSSTSKPAMSKGTKASSTSSGLPTRPGQGRSGRHGYNPSKMKMVEIDPRSIQAYYKYAQDMKNNAAQFQWGMDRVMMIYAAIAMGAAQKRSRGPVDPGMHGVRLAGHQFVGSPSGEVTRQQLYSPTAWKIPVRRISGAYFVGWRIQHVALGVWMLTNDSREAFYIEFGINHTGTGAHGPAGQRVRIRRPVMKLAVMESVKIVQATNAHINQVVSVVGPAGLYQSPYITGAIKKKGASGSAIGLVNLEALQALAGGGE